MKARIIAIAMMICLVPFSRALSQDTKTQDTMTIEGEVNLTGIYVDINGNEGGKAKATEYKDLKEPGGLYGSARLKLDTDKYFLNFEAGDFGYHTQYYQIDGGMWGKFSVNLFYKEIPHNITFDARSVFYKPGEDTLVGTPSPATVASWSPFDYSILRRQYGGGFKVDVLRPFFFDVAFDRENRNGIKPIGAAETSPGGRAFELPEPIDYATTNLIVSAGYARKPLFLSFNYVFSDFGNDNNSLNIPANFNAPRAISLPPDNKYHRGTFKGALSLPFNSRVSANVGFSTVNSETPTLPLGSNFRGKVDTQNIDVALTSNPLRFLDAKIYYKYYKRNNKSEDPTSVVDAFFNYRNTTYGGELGLRLPQNFYLTGGYKYVRTERAHEGDTDPVTTLPFNMDHNFFVDLRWSGLDFLEASAGYERLDRHVQYQTAQSATSSPKVFSYAPQERDTVKATLDIFPLENLNLGFEYRFKNADYTQTTLGLKREEGHEVEASVAYSLGKIAKLYAYTEFEWTKFWQAQADSSARPWEADQMDRSYGYGIGTEVYVIPKKLTLIFQHDYLKSNGNVDFTLSSGLFGAGGIPVTANQDNIDIGHWDDYTLYSFMIKAVYNITNHWEASLGYVFERFDYNDAQLDNYRFAPAGAASNSAFLTGAYKEQSYIENLAFVGLTYKF